MAVLQHAVLVIHLLGMAALFGGAFVQVRDSVKVINASMLYGAFTQVVSGIFLVGILEGRDEMVDDTKMGVKLAIALIIALLCWANRAKERVPNGVFYGVLGLTVANVVIAVFW